MTERELFIAVLAYDDANEKAALLDRQCAGDAAMRARVERLLAAHEQAGNFLGGARREATAEFSPPPNGVTNSSLEEQLIGQRVGPYRVVQKLGEGGMGSVWLADQSEPVRRQVALKVIKAGMDSSLVIARFEAERQALALMDHPNIAKILDAGATASGRPFFVMELVKGIPITKYCDQEHLSPIERLELFIPVCQAVQHAHQKGIIHRDLKPSNIMVGLYDGRPVPKIIDFGVAKATGQSLTDRTMFTEVGSIIGTLEYMAPEQAERNNLDIDTRADIYSLGVILYELLAGQPPFDSKQLRGAAFSEMLRVIREVEPQKPSTKLSASDELPSIAANRKSEPRRLAKLMHGDLDWIVMKCLEKERGRRYETANGLAMELQRFLAHEPVLAGPPSATYRVRKFLRRHKTGAIAACLLVAALVLGIVGTSWGLYRAQSERDAKELARVDAENRRIEAEEQRKRADQHAAIADAVNDFLCNDLLRQSDSHAQADRGFAEDPNLTVKTALQRASDRISDRFSKDTAVESAIRLTIGEALRGVGEAKQAIPHLERAASLSLAQAGEDHANSLKARQDLGVAYMDVGRLPEAIGLLEDVSRRATKKLGPNHRDTLTVDDYLAQSYRAAGRFKESITLSESVAKRCEDAFGPDDRHTLTALNNLGMEYGLAGRGADAIRVLSQVVEKRKIQPGPTHLDTMVTMHNLARAHLNAGQVADSVRLQQQVTDTLSAKLGPDHPNTLISRNCLGWAYQCQGKLQQAAEAYENVRDIQIKKLGPDHFDTLCTQHNLAGIYRELGRLDEGLKLQEHVRDRLTATVGPDHPNTIIALSQLGRAYQQVERIDEAIAMLKRVCEVQEAKRGPEDQDTLVALHNLAIAYRQAGRVDEAIAIHERVRDVYLKNHGAEHPNAMITLNNLALAYLDVGKQTEAIAIYDKVIETQLAKLGPNHPDTMISKHNLATALIKAKRFDDAVAHLEDILPRFRTTYSSDHNYTLICTNTLGDAYLKAGRFADAEKLMREAVALRAKTQPNHWSTAYAKALLGDALVGLQRYEEAESLLLQGYEGVKPPAGKVADAQQQIRGEEAAERLVRLYEAWGKPDDAAKWRKELPSTKP